MLTKLLRPFLLALITAISMIALTGCPGGGGGSSNDAGAGFGTGGEDTDGGDDGGTGGGDVAVQRVGTFTFATLGGVSELTANGTNATVVRATLLDLSSAPIAGITVTFTTTNGTLSTASQDTAADGIAQTSITAPTTTGLAVVTASITHPTLGTFTETVTIDFVPGPVSAANTIITANPASLPADGAATSTITVLALDANNNLVADGTSISLSSTAGTINGGVTKQTTLGRAEFELQADNAAGQAVLTLVGVPGPQTTVNFGVVSTGDPAPPASIETSVDNAQVFVRDVGRNSHADIQITVKDQSGNALDESNYDVATVNNLCVSFQARPNGGEQISGNNANGDNVNSTDDAPTGVLPLRTASGAATIGFDSGTLPGIVELRISVLDYDGTSCADPAAVTVLVAQISVASGPPESIVITAPLTNAITKVAGGVYERKGTAVISDRWGNSVPDGTLINFGMMDSIFVRDKVAGGDISDGSDLLVGSGPNITVAPALTDDFYALAGSPNNAADAESTTLVRNGTTFGIDVGTRVLLLAGAAVNKGRFVDSLAVDIVNTNRDFEVINPGTDEDDLPFVIGRTFFSSTISGFDAGGAKQSGTGVTKNSIAEFVIQYPVSEGINGTVLLGCFGDSNVDTRNPGPPRSRQVLVAVSSSDSGATAVSEQFCFSAIRPLEFARVPPDIGNLFDGSVQEVTVTVRDNSTSGEGVGLPFVAVTCRTNEAEITCDDDDEWTDDNGLAAGGNDDAAEPPEDTQGPASSSMTLISDANGQVTFYIHCNNSSGGTTPAVSFSVGDESVEDTLSCVPPPP